MAAAVFMLVPPVVIFMLAQRQVIETMANSKDENMLWFLNPTPEHIEAARAGDKDMQVIGTSVSMLATHIAITSTSVVLISM